jgi:hypothetical protein
MAGYANRVVTLHFPELSEEGDDIHIVMRNPKLVAPDELRRRDVAANPDGTPADMGEAMLASYEVIAKLIIGWFAYDATETDAEGNMPRLTLPATPAQVGKLPLMIINAISEEMGKVNPQKPTESPEAPTSRT